ncbi:MAG: hypothetical protein DMF95_00860 [Acidobacteria bacterium]|nr:MAG: hypothetical protein DMF95_00860 [Acidobacteriota bacterium]
MGKPSPSSCLSWVFVFVVVFIRDQKNLAACGAPRCIREHIPDGNRKIRWPKEGVVPLLSSIVELLRRERIPYTCFRHVPAYTALEEAAVSHTLERCWAKVVICIADDQPVQAVLQADHIADLEELRRLANADVLRLAGEDEIAVLYPDYEVGAMPPFGAVYGQRVFVDRCLVGEPEMVFNAGTHTEAICMHYGDFAELAKPVVGAFGRPLAHRDSATHARRRRTSLRVLSTNGMDEVS